MRAWVGAAAAVAVLLSGCATASAGTGIVTTSRVQTGHGSAGRQSGPPSGSRTGAVALAKQLIARQALPPGTRTVGQRVPPQLDGNPGIPGSGFVLRSRLLTAPFRVGTVQAFLLAHRPRDAHVSSSQAGLYGPPDTMWLTFDLTRPGYQTTELGFGLLPAAGGKTLVKEYAFVVWYPPRSAAEHIDPAGFGSVTATADLVIPGQPTRHLTRTVTSRAIIARLASALNTLPAAPYFAVPCPEFSTYSLRFRPAHRGVSSVLVTTLSCVADQVVVGRAAQPALWDTGQLAALAGGLLGLPSHRTGLSGDQGLVHIEVSRRPSRTRYIRAVNFGLAVIFVHHSPPKSPQG